jgi:transcriptional regulator with XRE-family HTH domain
MLEKIRDFFGELQERPNQFTLFMGDRIKAAREEAGLTYEDLAEKVYLRPAKLIDLENGDSEADTSTFVLLAYHLRKPLAYFLPAFIYEEMKHEDLDPMEQELLRNFLPIQGEALQRLAISLVRVIADTDPRPIVLELEDLVHGQMDLARAVDELAAKRRRKNK